MALWCVKGGRSGEREQRMLDHGVIGIGWTELGDLSRFKSRDDLARELRKQYPDAKEGAIPVNAG